MDKLLETDIIGKQYVDAPHEASKRKKGYRALTRYNKK